MLAVATGSKGPLVARGLLLQFGAWLFTPSGVTHLVSLCSRPNRKPSDLILLEK